MNDEQHKKTQFSLIYIFLALLLIFGLQYLLVQGTGNEISYSDFKQYLGKGMIKEVIISQTTIKGTMTGPEGGDAVFTTTRIEDPGLVKNLEEKGVRFSGKKTNTALGSLFSWLLPIIVMIAIWSFMMKRLGAGGPGILKMGQSKARLVADSAAEKINFTDVAGIDEAKEELIEVVEFLQRPAKFEELGGRMPKGILLVGARGPERLYWQKP